MKMTPQKSSGMLADVNVSRWDMDQAKKYTLSHISGIYVLFDAKQGGTS